jgi:DNA helicase-2/ATP-dependent DNA helicase PcrA
MTDPHLVTLNPEQRHAVEHGVRPLLINAGAGSGKTKTLAHRVAHLIVGGVDPRRIMLDPPGSADRLAGPVETGAIDG